MRFYFLNAHWINADENKQCLKLQTLFQKEKPEIARQTIKEIRSTDNNKN